MHNNIRYILWLFILSCFLPGAVDVSVAAEPVKYVSNRIRIQRPDIKVSMQQPSAMKPMGKEVAAEVETGEEGATGGKADESALTPDTIAALSPEDQNAIFLGSAGRFYTREGKVDPFEPFLRVPEAEVSNSEQEKLQIRAPQTPLERFDLDQLKLTGILVSPSKIRALIEEASGKGYIISEGTYIGNKGGQVTKITNDRVVVEEKYLDVLGKVAMREIEIKLRPDDE
jgi:type IV pilus assembly protein PilP